MMRFKFTLLLLALNIITFGLIFFVHFYTSDSPDEGNGLSALFGREIVEAERIELDGKKLENPRILQREGADWRIVEPISWLANHFAVNRILNQLQFLEAEARFSVKELKQTGQSLEDYGLEEPVVRLQVSGHGEPLSLQIGTSTDVGNNVYLLGPDERYVYVVNRALINDLMVDLEDLRSNDIFNIPVFEVEAISVQMQTSERQEEENAENGTLKVRLARSGDGWSFETPLSAKADSDLVSNTINALSATTVQSFLETDTGDSDPYGLETPSLRVTLHGNGRRQTLLLGDYDNASEGQRTYFAKLEDNPTLFTVEAEPFDTLRKAQEDLRERNFMTFDASALNAIRISDNEREVNLQKLETDAWQVLKHESGNDVRPYRADSEIMNELIEGLVSLRATGFAADDPTASDLERLGFENPERSVELSFSGGETRTLRFAHPRRENGELYAQNEGKKFIYLVDREPILDLLSLNALHYRTRELDKLPEAARITAFKLVHLPTGEIIEAHEINADAFEEKSKDETEEEEEETNAAPWDKTFKDLPEQRRSALLTLVQCLRRFEVKKYLEDSYAPSYQPEEEEEGEEHPWIYRLQADIMLPGGGDATREETRAYVFTERLSGTLQVGGSESKDVLFETTPKLLDALHVLAESMELPPEMTGSEVPPPDSVESLPEPSPTEDASEGADEGN